MATLQQQVQQHLQNTGISLRELSRRSGVSHTTIGKIVKGGTYKSDTAHALYSLISITPISTYKTLDATVEQLAAQCIDSDLTHVRDDALECGKQRRIAALEAEVSVWRKKADKAGLRVSELNMLVQRRDAELSDAKAEIEYFQQQHGRAIMLLSDERKEVQRLTALSETHAASWKAACVRSEHLQKQLDHGQAQFKSLQATYNQQVDDETEMLAQIDTLFAERETTATKHDQQVMRLRVYVWILIAALAFVVASGLVVWGGV